MPQTTRQALASKLQRELFEADGERCLAGSSFLVDRLVLWKTPAGDRDVVEDWERIAEVQLTG